MSQAKHRGPRDPDRRKVQVGLLAFEGCFVSGATGVPDMLLVANHVCRRRFGEHRIRFEWRFLTENGQPVRSANGLAIAADGSLDETAYDLVFVPAPYYRGRVDFRHWLCRQGAATAWLERQWRRGAVLATYGLGSFLFAEAGLLNGRAAATVWWLAEEFRTRYPQVRLRNDELLTDVDRIVCAGAASSLLYLVIKLIERFTSPAVALACARATQADLAHTLQSPYLNTRFEPCGNDPLVNAARFRIEQELGGEIRLAKLAAELGISQSTLIRRFKAVMGVTPQVFVQQLRVETAKQWLLSSQLPVEEIVERVGYADASSFTRLFRQRVGLSPGAFRDRFADASLPSADEG